MSKGTQKILLIQLRQLGDIMLTTPCIRELKRSYPDAQLSFLSHPMGRLILEGNPWLDQLYTYAPDSIGDEYRLLRQLRREGFQMVLDFMNNPRSALYSFFSAAQQTWSYSSSRRWAYHNTIPRAQTSDYIVREKFRLLRQLGLEPESEALTLPWGEEHLGPLRSLLEKPAYSQASMRVILSPTHRRPVRQWSKEKFAMLADRLVKSWGATVLWIWGPGEREFVESVRQNCREETLLCPKTSFRELAALMANADLFIGTSNGPSHVAVAVDTPSLQLHGPTQARAWCPMSERHRGMQSRLHLQDPQASMAAISLDDVWNELAIFRPFLAKNIQAERKKGVRISWDQDRSMG